VTSSQLADRLQTAQDLALSGGTELAPPTDEVKDQAVHPHHPSPVLKPSEDEVEATPEAQSEQEASEGGGVGHSMVEGAPEAIDERHDEAEEVDTGPAEDVQPAALDQDVAETVAREEVKDELPPTPEPVRAISPAPPEEERVKESDQNLEMNEGMEKDDIAPLKGEAPKLPEEEMSSNEGIEGRGDVPPEKGLRIEPRGKLKLDEGMERGDILTPPLPTKGLPDDEMDVNGDKVNGTRKRGRSDEPSVPEPTKRPRKTYNTRLPVSLSHLLHPPTSTLYITNLRRPLVHSALHTYLFPTSSPHSDRLPKPKPPFASSDHPSLWLSGVKDHAYATYPTIEAALAEAEQLEGQEWPEETGEKLHVEFIPDELVRGLVEREEFAWANGRQKVTLRIKPADDGGEVGFELAVSGAIGGRPGVGRPGPPPPGIGLARPPPPMGMGMATGRIAPVLSKTNAIRPPAGAPTGPAAGMGIRGRAVPPHMVRPGNGDLPGRPAPVRGARPGEGRLVNPMRRTKVRPGLFWKEGPGAVAK